MLFISHSEKAFVFYDIISLSFGFRDAQFQQVCLAHMCGKEQMVLCELIKVVNILRVVS